MSDRGVLVLTTVSATDDAKTIARGLVEARVAACVNIIDRVQSVYRWEGKVAEDGERLLLIKTAAARVEDLRAELFRLHPYSVPEFVVIPIEAMSEAYGAWVVESVS